MIAAAGYIFLDIAVNGSKAVFTTKAPFINVSFLTEKPQTLHVFEPKEPYDAIQANGRKILSLNTKINALGSNETEQPSRPISTKSKPSKRKTKRSTSPARPTA